MGILRFIQPQILARLRAGKFVAERRQKQAGSDQDRRDTLSPLAIAKRCIRYDPSVFANRSDLVLKLADDLNDSDVKILMLLGEQGSGKTSLIRGLVELTGGELAGGGQMQLLWFDAHRYTDFEEITDF